MTLPKGYLSYSAWYLWRTNKQAYRDRYYPKERPPDFESVETIFGKSVHEKIENGELLHVPRFPLPEHKIEVEVAGIKLMGQIDTFDEQTFSFADYKSGHANKKGESPWTLAKVMKLDQLPFYSVMVEAKYGRVNPLCQLIWLETEFVKKSIDFEGHILESISRELQLTGRVESFPRRIAKWERERMKKLIIETANEISEDYERFGKI